MVRIGRPPLMHRPGHRAEAHTPVPLSWMVLAVLVIAVVGWLQLQRFEAHLNAQLDLGGSDDTEGQGYPSLQDSLKQGPASASQGCVATLEAAGVLPSSQGAALLAGRKEAAGGGGAGAAKAAGALAARRRLYESMEASLQERGLSLGEAATQGLALGDIFTLKAGGGGLQPVLTELSVPVRAVVLPLRDPQVSKVLEAAVRRHLAPLLPPAGLWVQNSSMYHSTIYHASTHMDPVPATPAEVDAEEGAIRGVGAAACPLRVVLERVVATPSGTVLACWQVAGGTDVLDLRHRLAAALPGASRQQVVSDLSILHTTLARVVAHPRAAAGDDAAAAAAAAAAAGGGGAAALQAAVDSMTQELCGLQGTLGELWFAEERDKLALALNGRFKERRVPLQCGRHARRRRE